MAFDFGAGLTAAGTVAPEMDAARQKALLDLQQKQKFSADRRTQALQQQIQQGSIDQQKRTAEGWIKVGDPRTLANGEVHQIYMTPTGHQDIVEKPARPSYDELYKNSGGDAANLSPGYKEMLRAMAIGVPSAQASVLARGASGGSNNDTRARQDYEDYKQAHPEFTGTFEEFKTEQAGIGRATAMKEQTDLRTKALALQTAKFEASKDPNNPATKAAVLRAQAEYEKAQASSLNSQGRYLGTYNGEPIEGSMVSDRGKPVGSANAPNVRPTGMQRQRSNLAGSSLEQMADMKEILTRRADEFGPAAGTLTDFETWWGSQDPDAARLRSAAVTVAGHLAGVFGGTSDAKLKDIKTVIGNNRTNPEAAIAAIEQMEKAAKNIQEQGVVHTVGGGAFVVPADAPPAPQENNKLLKKNGQVVAKSENGKWVAP